MSGDPQRQAGPSSWAAWNKQLALAEALVFAEKERKNATYYKGVSDSSPSSCLQDWGQNIGFFVLFKVRRAFQLSLVVHVCKLSTGKIGRIHSSGPNLTTTGHSASKVKYSITFTA